MRILVVQHHKENRKKCTLTPLRHRDDIDVLVPRPGSPVIPIGGGILLAVSASVLAGSDREHLQRTGSGNLVLIDANWIKVPSLLSRLQPRAPLIARSLPPEIQTAYPRHSKIHQDPPGGLATVEAMYSALAILGVPDSTLLEGYPWAEPFLALNREFFDAKSSQYAGT